jgi:hypothetical protein
MGVAVAPLNMEVVCHKNRFGATPIYKLASSLALTNMTEPCPVPKDEWTVNIIYSMNGDGQLVLSKEPVVQTILDPKTTEMPIFPTHGRIECGE